MIFLFSLLISNPIYTEKDTIKISLNQDSWWTEDKLHHFLHSTAITSSTYLISKNIGKINKEKSIYISISLGSIAGIAKEISDEHKKNGSFSLKDLIYDIAGIAAGILLVSIGGS
jgi:uncharacterized protein YfiM (DUF2279 family)